MVESIFSVQLPTPFHHHYFHQEKCAPLRSCKTWPRLNSCSCSVQSKGTPMGAYLTHPSIKAEAKARKQVHDSFSLKLLSSSSDALPRHPIFHISSNARSSNEAPNGKCHQRLSSLVPSFVWCYDRTGRVEPIPASGYLRRRR